MFADNHRISRIQAERQYLLAYLGPLVLWIGPKLQGRNGFLSILAGILILGVWIFFLLRQVHIFRYPERYWGKIMSRVLALVYGSYLVLTGGWLAANAAGILREYMIQGIPHWIAAGLFVLAALGSSKELQERARFAETAWPAAGGILALLLLLAAFQGQGGQGQQTQAVLTLQESPVWNGDSAKEILRGTVWVLVSLLGTVLIPFLEVDYNGGQERWGFPVKMLGKTALWLCSISVLLQAVFGTRGAETLKFPVLNMMAGVRIPGGFVRRIDMIFLTVALFALLFSMGSIFFYGKYIFRRAGVRVGRIPIAVICFLLGTMDLGGWSLTEEYPKIIGCIYLPLFALITVCNVMLRKRKLIHFLCCVLVGCGVLGLSGCQIVEPEKRAYPLVMGIDWQDDQYRIYLGMARLAVSTGQGKDGGDEQQGQESGALVLSGGSKEEILELYDQTQELYLDPGHVQAVIFGEGLLAEPDRARGVLEAMEAETGLGNSAYAFTASELGEIFQKNGTQVESLGKYLAGIYENRTWDEEPVTLSQLYRRMHNTGSLAEMPEITVVEGGLRVEGSG